MSRKQISGKLKTMTAEKKGKGLFIVVEGMDGSGKSTCTAYLEQKLKELGHDTLRTYEVGGTPIGKELRGLCFKVRDDEVLHPLARALMIYAARLQHVTTVVKPATNAGKVVVCDRYTPTTRVYQGALDGMNKELDRLDTIGELQGLAEPPDVIVYISVDVERAYQRGVSRTAVDNDTYKNDVEKAKKIKAAYDEVMREHLSKGHVVMIINGNDSLESVHKQLDVVADRITRLAKEVQTETA